MLQLFQDSQQQRQRVNNEVTNIGNLDSKSFQLMLIEKSLKPVKVSKNIAYQQVSNGGDLPEVSSDEEEEKIEIVCK